VVSSLMKSFISSGKNIGKKTGVGYKIYSGAAAVLILFLIWNMMARRLPAIVLPSPLETFQALYSLFLSGELIAEILITLRRTFIGFGLAILMGLILAVMLKSGKRWRFFFRPLITIVQVTPPVVWLIMAVIWFGIADDLTPIFLIFIVTFPLVFLNIFSGLEDIKEELLEMARVYRFNKKQILFSIYLPSLIPHLVSAISIGLSFAWKSSVFAEFIGSNSGIGFALSMAHSNLNTEVFFAWAMVLIILMLVFEYLILQPLYSSVTVWRKNEDDNES